MTSKSFGTGQADFPHPALGQDFTLARATPSAASEHYEPGRVALICRIVSLRALAAPIAFHLGAELVQRHGAEHRNPLAEHLEGQPHGALAALAPDPGIVPRLSYVNVPWQPSQNNV